MLTLIAAIGENNSLGLDNKLLWHLPNDFKRFKKLTTRHYIIMGRKTFESLPGILPNRTHIVITRDQSYSNKNCIIVHSLEEAISLTKDDPQPFIIGGGEIYKQSIEIADRIELTRVHECFEADVFFPRINHDLYELSEIQFNYQDNRHKYDYSYLTYDKK
jgi:dihydrofolate reductase